MVRPGFSPTQDFVAANATRILNLLDLLFHNNEKEIALLGQHPAILWKLENVRMHRLDHEMS